MGDDDSGLTSGSTYFYDLGTPLTIVTFEPAPHGTRTDGGELVQNVLPGTAAVEPVLEINPGYILTGWDVEFLKCGRSTPYQRFPHSNRTIRDRYF